MYTKRNMAPSTLSNILFLNVKEAIHNNSTATSTMTISTVEMV